VHFGVLLVHCAVDFDMSFFYVKLLAFVLIGIISSYKTEEKLEGKKINIKDGLRAIYCIWKYK